MNPLWLLPSLALGVFYGLGSGNWIMLAASTLTMLVSLFISRGRKVPEGELRITSKGVWLGEKRLPRLNLFWSKALHQAVIDALPKTLDESALRSLREANWKCATPQSYLVGIGSVIELSNGSGHLLVIGPTGAGKSELIHLVLASLDQSVEVLIADYKGGAVLTEVTGISGVTDLAGSEAQSQFWTSLVEDLSNREQHLRSSGVASIEQAQRVGLEMPRRLVVVDEVVAAIRSNTSALAALTGIATRGRSLGVHLLVTSQSLVGIPREVLVNLRSRLALAGTDEVELLQLGFKEKIGTANGKTKAALLSKDGSVSNVLVPLGARRAPRIAV